MDLLVTGANGLIGHRLCSQLLAEGHRVWALSRSREPALLQPLLPHPRLRLVTGDITAPAFTEKLLRARPYQCIFNFAVARHSADPAALRPPAIRDTIAYRTNFEGTLNLLQAASRHHSGLWIQGSAMMIFDIEHIDQLPVAESHPAGPAEPNGLSVFLVEQACHYYGRVHGLRYAVMRYPGVFGPGKPGGVIAHFVRHCLSGADEALVAPANRTSDFLYADDAAGAAVLTLKWLQESTVGETGIGLPVFHIGSGRETSVAEAARLIRELTGSATDITETQASRSRRFFFDNTRACRLLGFQPRSLRQGLSEYIEHMRKESDR